MIISVLSIGVHRVMAAETTVSLLGKTGEAGTPSVFPIQIPDNAPTPAVTINRLFERREAGQTSAVVAVTVMTKTVQELETVGGTVVAEIDGTCDFVFGDLNEICFDKAGPDVTGYDHERGLMLRQIEFVVSW